MIDHRAQLISIDVYSILREHTMDGTGWMPTRTLLDVVWGLNSLFTVRL